MEPASERSPHLEWRSAGAPRADTRRSAAPTPGARRLGTRGRSRPSAGQGRRALAAARRSEGARGLKRIEFLIQSACSICALRLASRATSWVASRTRKGAFTLVMLSCFFDINFNFLQSLHTLAAALKSAKIGPNHF